MKQRLLALLTILILTGLPFLAARAGIESFGGIQLVSASSTETPAKPPASTPPPPAPPMSAPAGQDDVLKDPLCFNVVNKAPYTVYGSLSTNFYTAADGKKARHRSNFRLNEQEQAQFCTYGPFFDNQKLDLVLRTLVPVFSCKTAVTGDILIYGRRKAEGGTDTWAVCL